MCLSPSSLLCSRVECVDVFLRSAADVTALNHDGHSPSSLAAGFDHPQCMKLLQDYGGSVNSRAAMLLSARRRSALASVGNLQSPREMQERMDRIAAVWERVLDAATRRLDAATGVKRLESPESPVMFQERGGARIEEICDDPEEDTRWTAAYVAAKKHVTYWTKQYDPAMGCCYFVSTATGEAVWSGEAASYQRFFDADIMNKYWTQCTDADSGCGYMYNTMTGASEWLASDDNPSAASGATAVTGRHRRSDDADNCWMLRLDDASLAPYFLHATSGESEWVHDPSFSVKDWARVVQGPSTGNLWTRHVDPHTLMSYFVNSESLGSVWGAPISK